MYRLETLESQPGHRRAGESSIGPGPLEFVQVVTEQRHGHERRPIRYPTARQQRARVFGALLQRLQYDHFHLKSKN